MHVSRNALIDLQDSGQFNENIMEASWRTRNPNQRTICEEQGLGTQT